MGNHSTLRGVTDPFDTLAVTLHWLVSIGFVCHQAVAIVILVAGIATDFCDVNSHCECYVALLRQTFVPKGLLDQVLLVKAQEFHLLLILLLR